MQISKRHLSPELEHQLKDTLAQVVADINSKERADKFLQDFLTKTEYMAMAKRFGIMLYLQKGASYEEIKQEVKVSSATIANIQSQLDKGSDGLNIALRMVKAEEWASKWAGKLTGLFGR